MSQRVALWVVSLVLVACDGVSPPVELGHDGGVGPTADADIDPGDGGGVETDGGSETDGGTEPPDPLDEVVRDVIEAHQSVPNVGFAVAVLERGEVRFVGTYGYRDRVARLPVTRDTMMSIGSSTKAFTSFTALTLAEEGSLDLDAPIRTVLTDFDTPDPVVDEQATMIDLLSHRTGLGRHDILWSRTDLTRAEIYGRLRYLEDDPTQTFRGGITYNNLMYMVAGVLMERVTGETWEELVRARILAPLGMARTVLGEADREADDDVALGYIRDIPVETSSVDAIAPAGSIFASIHDMARWARMWIAGGVAEDGTRLLREDILSRAFRSENPLPVDAYGLGWTIADLDGFRVIGHGGHLSGHSASVSFIPELGIGVVVMSNDDLSPAVGPLVRAIYQSVLTSGDHPSGSAEAVAAYFDSLTYHLIWTRPPPEEDPVAETPVSLEGILAEATFRHPGYGDLRVVELAAGDTYAVEWRGNVFYMTHADGLTYYAWAYTAGYYYPLPLTYELDPGGRIVALTIPFSASLDAPSRFDLVSVTP